MDPVRANHYVLDGVVAGTVDTSSLTGAAVVSLTVDGEEAKNVQVRDTVAGLRLSALLDSHPDRDSRHLLLSLPRVNVTDAAVTFAAVAIVITALSTVGGPDLVEGVLHSYVVHPVAGSASAVEF